MNTPNPSRWDQLFHIALEIIDSAGGDQIIAPWSLGGGTALMLQIGHRESHDIDIFIDDPQVLALLNPIIQDYPLSLVPSDYITSEGRSLKVIFNGVGEIDFICCGHLAVKPTFKKTICNQVIQLETPAEILAKKIFHRCKQFQPRDIFDLVAIVRTVGITEVIPTLRTIEKECVLARNTISRMDAQFAEAIMGQLMEIRDPFKDLPSVGKREAIDYLNQIIG